ncbi:MAG: radical SAM protein [Alicyclobacillaceae bacterium]|nr:radical SAM protein [Alicyclobacillaceae bacterium]
MATPSFQPLYAKQALNRVQSPGMPFQWSLNPFRGCTHGCSFCYARAFHTYMGLDADDTFQREIWVKVNAADVLDRQLERLARRHRWNLAALAADIGTIVIGTATDPYQPVEAQTEVTRECLKVLAAYRVPVSITTRSPLILRDLDLLTQMPVRVHISVHTLDKAVWRALEPATPAPDKRLQAVRELTQAGVQTGVFLAPIIPGLTDRRSDIRELLQAVRDSGGQFAVPSVLRLTPDVKAWFFQTLARAFPDVLPYLHRLYAAGAEADSRYVSRILQAVQAELAALGLSERPGRPLAVTPATPGQVLPPDAQPPVGAEPKRRRAAVPRAARSAAWEQLHGAVVRPTARVRGEQLPLPL